MARRFVRSGSDSKIAGVCGGLGAYFDVDPNLMRFAAVGVAVFTAILPAVILYIAAWVIFPESTQAGSV